MEGIIIFAIIVIVFISAASKAKKQQQRKAPPAQSSAPGQPFAPAQPAVRAPGAAPSTQVQGMSWHCLCGKDNLTGARFCVKCGRSRADGATGSLGYYSTQGELTRGTGEGQSIPGSTEGYSTEGRAGGPLSAVKPSLRHVVRAVTESAHAHTEGGPSQEGGPPCEEEYDPHTRDSYELTGPDAYEIGQESQALPYGLSFTGADDLARGVILAEILAKPRALRAR